MKTTNNFAISNREILQRVLKKFTVKREGADGIGSSSWLTTEFSYNYNEWCSVVVDEMRNENDCSGIFSFTVYYSHPEWGVSILAENECRFRNWSERTEIMVHEFIECVGIIELA